VRVARLLMRLSLGATVAGLGAMLLGGTSSASSGPPRVIPTCAGLKRSPVVYRAGSVVVYRSAVPGDGGRHDWACESRSRGSSTSALGLGTGAGGGFAPGAVVGDFASDGPWLVDLASSKRGWSSCDLSTSTRPCRREHHEVELTDVADGGQTSTSSAAHVEMHLSVLPVRDGYRTAAVAWTQPAKGSLITLKVITARDGRGSGTFGLNPPVTGRIDPSSVRLHGLTVSFIENGRHRTIRLGV